MAPMMAKIAVTPTVNIIYGTRVEQPYASQSRLFAKVSAKE
jgi:hypothetical protein